MVLIATALFLANKPRFLSRILAALIACMSRTRTSHCWPLLLLLIHLIIVPPAIIRSWRVDRLVYIPIHVDHYFADHCAARSTHQQPSQRLSYGKWKGVHKYMGLLFILGAYTLLMSEPLILHAPVIFGYVGTIVTLGTALTYTRNFYGSDSRNANNILSRL